MPSSEDKAIIVTEETQAATSQSSSRRRNNQRQTLVIVLILLLWTYVYNIFIKNQSPLTAFFKILDTISDDFVMGSMITISVGLMIVVVFSVMKLYGQIIANIYSFKMLEDMWYSDVRQGRFRDYFAKLLNFTDQPSPDRVCPQHTSSVLFSFSLIYFMSWVYVILFSEALFFVSWSAGVDLPITEKNMLMMPTLALAIPFSARVMAYLRYPYTLDYADFMPAAVFVLLVVTSLGYLFESTTQEFFLWRVYQQPRLLSDFITNGIFLAFIPVFFEAVFWLIELHRNSNLEQKPEVETDNVSAEIKRTAK